MSLRRLTRARPARILLATIGLLGALAALIVRAAPPSLLARAKEAADASGWIAMPPNWRNGVSFGTLNTYAWLSSRELLVFVGNKATPVAWQQDGPMLGPSSPGAACIYGLSSGRYTRIERLSALLLRHVGCTDASLRVSPDHSRLWWVTEAPTGIGYVSPVDGSAAQSIDSDWFDTWTADGNHIAQFEWRGEELSAIVLRDVPNVHRTRRFAVPSGFGIPLRVGEDRAVGIVRPQSATWDDMKTPVVSNVQITEMSLCAHAGLKTTQVHLPGRAILTHTWMAPDGTKIAWLFVRTSRVGVPRWLHWVIPRAMSRPSTTTSLWVSDGHGQKMREIGEIRAASTTRPAIEAQLIRWLPDSQHVSFVYNGHLYIVYTD